MTVPPLFLSDAPTSRVPGPDVGWTVITRDRGEKRLAWRDTTPDIGSLPSALAMASVFSIASSCSGPRCGAILHQLPPWNASPTD